jgi:hypothetical protein
MRLKIAWAYDGYKVSVPNWDGGEVVTADEYDALLAAATRVVEAEFTTERLGATQELRELLATNQAEANDG